MGELVGQLASMLSAGTPLLIAGLGLLIHEKVGVLNLGAEGLMLVGAVAGFAGAFWGGSTWAGLAAGALAGGLFTMIFAVLVIFFMTNQYATGLALALFGSGFSAFVGTGFVQERLDIVHTATVPWLVDMPVLGPLMKLHPMVYLAVLLMVLVAWLFYRTRAGLIMRAVGESPESAHALGYPVRSIRMLAVICGGALCGLAGAYIAVISASSWNEGMIAGKGWIALALTSFATWRPGRILFGAYLFGGVTMLQLYMQAKDIQLINPFMMNMLPYVATIVVLIFISRKPQWIRVNMPASLGKPFHPGG